MVGADPHGTPPSVHVLEEVLAAAQAGAPWALTRIVLWLHPAVAAYLEARGAKEVDDLCNEVFLRVVKKVSGFSGTPAQFRSWVFTIAHNLLVDDYRRRSRRPAIEVLAPDVASPAAGDDLEGEVVEREATEAVRSLLERLAPSQKEVLLLRVVAGLTVEETAEVMGRSSASVKALQCRGVAQLRQLLAADVSPLPAL